MLMLPMRRLVAALVPTFLFATNAGAQARSADELAAEALFAEARAAMRDGEPARACPKFQRSMELDPAAGTALNLAECQLALGKTASAWLAYREAATLARRSSHEERERFARDRAAALEPNLCRLSILVDDAAAARPNFRVDRDGVEVRRASWGQPIPTDPGRYEIHATGDGLRPFAQTVTLARTADGGCGTTEVRVTAIAVEVPANDAPAGGPIANTGGWRAPHTVAAVLAISAAGALATGAVFAFDARAKNERGDALCTPGCSQEGLDQIRDAARSADVATVAISIGAAAAVGAVVTWILSPPLARAQATAVANPGGGALILRF
jgi:tetratricopeptide (TPR) repeat protein